MIKNIFLIFFLLQNLLCFSQQNPIESIYNLTTKGELENSDLPSEINTSIAINAQIKVIRNNEYCMLVIIESNLDNQLFSGIAHSENDGDTLFFDIQHQKVYSLSDRKCYWYLEHSFDQENIQSDTLKKSDTLLIFSSQLNKYISPTPTLKKMSKGIMNYSTQSFSFKYISSKPSNFALETLYNKVKDFIYVNKKFDFAY